MGIAAAKIFLGIFKAPKNKGKQVGGDHDSKKDIVLEKAGHIGGHLVKIRYHFGTGMDQILPIFCEEKAVVVVDEKALPQFLFQIAKGLSEGLSGDEETFGGSGVIQGLGRFEKVS